MGSGRRRWDQVVTPMKGVKLERAGDGGGPSGVTRQ